MSEFLSSVPPEAERYRLTAEQIRHFEQFGFVAGIRVLEPVQLEQLKQELVELMDPSRADSELWYEYHRNEAQASDAILFHALGAWRLAPGFHDLLWHPAAVRPAEQLLGGTVRFWHDQLFCKPARHGGVVAWHQDYSYWTRTAPMAHLTCWIALDDSAEDNGCLHYLPASHRWPLLPNTGLAGDMNAIDAVLTPEQRRNFDPVPIRLTAGEAAFHHPLLVHGSFENRSERARRATVLNFLRDGVCSRSSEALLRGVPPIAPGQPLEGRYFPALSGPDSKRDWRNP